LGLHPVAVVGRLVQKNERDSTKGETIHKITQKQFKKPRIHKKENKTQSKNIKSIFKKSCT